MSTSAPVKKGYDIPIVKPEEAPRRLNPGVPAPMVVNPTRVPERVPEMVPVRRKV